MNAALAIAMALYEAIKETGDAGIPEGELYAMVMPTGLNLEMYTRLIDKLEELDLISRKYHLLKAK